MSQKGQKTSLRRQKKKSCLPCYVIYVLDTYVTLFAYIKVGNFVAILVRKTKKAMKVPYFA